MSELIIKIVYMVLYVIAAAGRAPIAQKVKKMKAIISVKQKREYVLLFFGSIMMVLPLFYVFSDLLDSYNMGLPMFVRIIGGIAFAFAVYLHNWSHNALDVNWSPTLQIKKNQKLITKGPYKYVRHPMYSAFFLWVLSPGVFLSNWLVGVGGIASFALLYFVRVGDEEKLMIKQFGKGYKDYMKKTNRLVPGLM